MLNDVLRAVFRPVAGVTLLFLTIDYLDPDQSDAVCCINPALFLVMSVVLNATVLTHRERHSLWSDCDLATLLVEAPVSL
jgi:hypothetical protein